MMVALYLLSGVISASASVLALLLTMILQRLGKLEAKLDSKQDKAECAERRRTCRENFDDNDIWTAFNTHSHEGLPLGSKVTR